MRERGARNVRLLTELAVEIIERDTGLNASGCAYPVWKQYRSRPASRYREVQTRFPARRSSPLQGTHWRRNCFRDRTANLRRTDSAVDDRTDCVEIAPSDVTGGTRMSFHRMRVRRRQRIAQ